MYRTSSTAGVPSQPTMSASIRALSRSPYECEVIVTRNHEYYVSGGICFAERDRASGRCLERHASIGVAQPLAMPTDGSERDAQNASWIPPAPDTKPSIDALTIATPLERTPRTGEWVCLQHSGALHCTGPVLAVERRATRVAR